MAGLVTASEWRVKRRCATLPEVRLKVRVTTAAREIGERSVRLIERSTNKQPTYRKALHETPSSACGRLRRACGARCCARRRQVSRSHHPPRRAFPGRRG